MQQDTIVEDFDFGHPKRSPQQNISRGDRDLNRLKLCVEVNSSEVELESFFPEPINAEFLEIFQHRSNRSGLGIRDLAVQKRKHEIIVLFELPVRHRVARIALLPVKQSLVKQHCDVGVQKPHDVTLTAGLVRPVVMVTILIRVVMATSTPSWVSMTPTFSVSMTTPRVLLVTPTPVSMATEISVWPYSQQIEPVPRHHDHHPDVVVGVSRIGQFN